MNVHLVKGSSAFMLVMALAPASAVTTDQRYKAAKSTAESGTQCAGLSFFWEIGDKNGRLLLSDGVTRTQGATGSSPPNRDDVIRVYSAGKWLWGGYVAQIRNGILPSDAIAAMRMSDGYIHTSLVCPNLGTVSDCASDFRSIGYTGVFNYESGPFSHLAAHGDSAGSYGLADADNLGLATAVGAQVSLPGRPVSLSYYEPVPASGAVMSTANYAAFLQNLLQTDGTALKLRPLLGTNTICTDRVSNEEACAKLLYPPQSPVRNRENWRYSIGHWLENDANVRSKPSGKGFDAAHSSPGYAGFYPWIDSSRTWYGIVAREVNGGYQTSVDCGRTIRKAWLEGVPQDGAPVLP